MKEQDIQRAIINWIESKGGYVVKVIQASKAGTPDLVCSVDGFMIGLEVKTPKGRPSKLQEYHIEKIIKSGGVAGIVRSVADVEALLLARLPILKGTVWVNA